MRTHLEKLDSFTLETSKNHLIRTFFRNGRLRVNKTDFQISLFVFRSSRRSHRTKSLAASNIKGAYPPRPFRNFWWIIFIQPSWSSSDLKKILCPIYTDLKTIEAYYQERKFSELLRLKFWKNDPDWPQSKSDNSVLLTSYWGTLLNRDLDFAWNKLFILTLMILFFKYERYENHPEWILGLNENAPKSHLSDTCTFLRKIKTCQIYRFH